MNEQELLQDSILRVISTPSGPRVSSVVAPKLVGGSLYLADPGDVYIYGNVLTPLNLSAGVSFGDGSAANPTIAFSSDKTSGYYLNAINQLGVSVNGTAVAAFGLTGLTSIGRDLVINSATSNIDFSGKNIVNVGNYQPNPNWYDVTGNQVSTTNTVPTTILTIPTQTGSVYTISSTVSASEATGGSGSYLLALRAQNIAGLLTLSSNINYTTSLTSGISATSVTASVSGTSVILQAVGIAGNMKWFATASVNKCSF